MIDHRTRCIELAIGLRNPEDKIEDTIEIAEKIFQYLINTKKTDDPYNSHSTRSRDDII